MTQSKTEESDAHITSPLREDIESQTEKINLKKMNLELFTQLNDTKEKVNAQQKMLRKKESQIAQLKELLDEGEHLRDQLERNVNI